MRRKLATDVLIVGAADVLKGVRFLIVLPLVTKWLGVEAYGVWTQIKVTSMLLALVASLGMNRAMPRFLSGEVRPDAVRSQFNSALWVALWGSLLAMAALLLWPEAAARLVFGDRALAQFVVATAVYVLLETLDQVTVAYFQASRLVLVHALFVIAELLGEILLVGVLAVRGAGLATIVSGMVVWKGAIVAAKLARGWQGAGLAAPAPAVVQQYLAFGFPLMLSGCAFLLVNYSDRFFINFFLGIGAVGTYAAAYALGSLPIVAVAPIDYVLYPTIVPLWNAGRITEAARQVEMTLRWFVIALVAVLAALAVLAGPLMGAIGTAALTAAAPVALVVAAAFTIFSIGVVGERILALANRARTITGLYVALAIVNAVLNVALVPRAGLMGAGVATLVSFAIYTTVTLVLARRVCPFALPISTAWRALVAGGAAAVAALPAAGPETWRIVLALGIWAFVYPACLLAVRGIRLEPGGLWAAHRGSVRTS